MAEQKDLKALKRAEVILNVRGEKLTASQGAEELGVSRKTFYKWETEALSAMMGVLADKEPGRPQKPVDEKEALKTKLAQLEQELALLKRSQYVREVFQRYEAYKAEAAAKKSGAKKKRNSGQTQPKP
jgi:DNA-binding XRE family transcriptional regulator